MNRDILLLSLHPRFATALFSGEKRVELRRTRPRLVKGSKLLAYATAPTSSLMGTLVVENVLEGSPTKLWPLVKDICGISRAEFFKYFEGAKKAYGIMIEDAHALDEPISLYALRDGNHSFRPPQCYHYVSEDMVTGWVGVEATAT